MYQENYDDFDDNYDDPDAYGESYSDDPEAYSSDYYEDDYGADDGDAEEWPVYPEPGASPPRAYYSLNQPPHRYSDSREPSQPPPGSFLTGAPGPGCIAVVTIVVCLSMAVFLLRLAAGIQLPNLAAIVDPAAAATASAQPVPQPQAAPLVSSEAGNTPCEVSSLFPEKVLRWCGLITFYAKHNDLSPDLVAALVWLESGGDELAYSRSGAVGLMQVMPSDGLAASFMCVNGPCFADRPTTTELQNPEFNIAWGTRFLAGLLRRHGDVREALRRYGPMDVGFSYADKVLGLFERYKTPAPAVP
jgi:hypothetical protein